MIIVRRAAPLLACLALVAAACGGGGGSSETIADPVSAAPPPPPPASPSPPPPAPPPPASPPASPSTVSNPNGPCLTVNGANNRVIENMTLGPCGGAGIEILNSTNVTLRNVRIRDTREPGIFINGSTSVDIRESNITNAASGVYAVSSSGIKVQCSSIVNPQGPMPRGQFVQFDKVVGGENLVSCNSGLNELGKGIPEDQINLYQSRGTAATPITISNNLLQGGGPSKSGGGIMLGDSGGQYQVARGNVLVDPGQYGIAVAGGTNITVDRNQVYGRQQSFTNVGMYVWNQYSSACSAITVSNNQVNWRNSSGGANNWWDGGNCGSISGISTNTFGAAITETIARLLPATSECSCVTYGRK